MELHDCAHQQTQGAVHRSDERINDEQLDGIPSLFSNVVLLFFWNDFCSVDAKNVVANDDFFLVMARRVVLVPVYTSMRDMNAACRIQRTSGKKPESLVVAWLPPVLHANASAPQTLLESINVYTWTLCNTQAAS